jgi:hypothetical protein
MQDFTQLAKDRKILTVKKPLRLGRFTTCHKQQQQQQQQHRATVVRTTATGALHSDA